MNALVTGSHELDLYCSNRTAWLQLVAPRMAERLRATPLEELPDVWGCLARDYQREVWAVLDDTTREAIRIARLPKIRTVLDCPMPERDLFDAVEQGVPA